MNVAMLKHFGLGEGSALDQWSHGLVDTFIAELDKKAPRAPLPPFGDDALHAVQAAVEELGDGR